MREFSTASTMRHDAAVWVPPMDGPSSEGRGGMEGEVGQWVGPTVCNLFSPCWTCMVWPHAVGIVHHV